MGVVKFLSGICLSILRVRANKRLKALLRVLQYDAADPKMQMYNTFIRGRAARTLGLLGDERAVEPLTKALYDADRWVRMAAAWALGMLGDTRAESNLTEALEDEDWLVRTEAHKALLRIKSDN